MIAIPRRGFIAVLTGVAFVIGSLVAFVYFSHSILTTSENRSIAEEWTNNIERLGISAVYPPTEDIKVGDVFLYLEPDPNFKVLRPSYLAQSVLIDHDDVVDQELRRFYTTRYSPEHLGANNKCEPPQGGAIEVFSPEIENWKIPIVVFPAFKIENKSDWSLEGRIPSHLLSLAERISSHSTDAVTVSITAASTYGIPLITARSLKTRYCLLHPGYCEGPLVESLATDIRVFPSDVAKLYFVYRVYLARSIVYSYDVERDKGLATSAIPSGGPSSNQPAETADKKTIATIDTASGSATAAIEGGTRVSLTETFDRPVVIGYRAMRYQP